MTSTPGTNHRESILGGAPGLPGASRVGEPWLDRWYSLGDELTLVLAVTANLILFAGPALARWLWDRPAERTVAWLKVRLAHWRGNQCRAQVRRIRHVCADCPQWARLLPGARPSCLPQQVVQRDRPAVAVTASPSAITAPRPLTRTACSRPRMAPTGDRKSVV